MKHAIIIPHRDRLQYLDLCLWSITRSAMLLGRQDYEVIVVDNGSYPIPSLQYPNVKLVASSEPMPVFNKCRLLNIGFDHARSQYVTFLDGDAIVGAHWLEGIDQFDYDPDLMRLCYRVRLLRAETLPELLPMDTRVQRIDDLFRRYNARDGGFTRGFEGYGTVRSNAKPWEEGGTPVFGNSQATMRRVDLEKLRHDEGFVGRSYEDWDFMEQFWDAHYPRYKGKIMKDPTHAMFHVQHSYSPDWLDPTRQTANKHRFIANHQRRVKHGTLPS